MTIIPHISSLYSAPWVAWVLFALLFLLVVNPSPQVNVLVGLRSVFSHSERVYASHAREWGSEICSHLFRMGTVALAVLLLAGPIFHLTFTCFAKVLGVVVAVYSIQRLLMHAIGKVFVSQKNLDAALEQYNGICTMMCVCLYPMLILILNFPGSKSTPILCGSILALFLVLVLWKSIRLFYVKFLSVFYILLYIICLEVIPLAVIFTLAKQLL